MTLDDLCLYADASRGLGDLALMAAIGGRYDDARDLQSAMRTRNERMARMVRCATLDNGRLYLMRSQQG